MSKKTVLTTGLLLSAFCFVNCSDAGSIWAKRSRDMRNLYVDDVARQIGDVLTITIDESSGVSKTTKRSNEKKTDRSATFDGQLGIATDHESFIPRMPGIGVTASSNNKLDGKADYTDNRSFNDSITVVVIDILPNSNLVVLGTRNRDIVGDKQIVEISGIVRPSDIAFDNTVDSERVANFRIVARNEGAAERYNRQGWLGGIFDVLWPF